MRRIPSSPSTAFCGFALFNAALLDVLIITFSTVFVLAVTVTSQVASNSPAFAVIVAAPSAIAETTPSATVTTASFELVQTIASVAFSGSTGAVSVRVSPAGIERAVSFSAMPVAGIATALTVTKHAFGMIGAVPSVPSAVTMYVPALANDSATLPSESVVLPSSAVNAPFSQVPTCAPAAA